MNKNSQKAIMKKIKRNLQIFGKISIENFELTEKYTYNFTCVNDGKH